MKKEIILAVLLGLVLGLVITYGIYRARTSLQESATPSPSPTASDENGAEVSTDTNLVLSSPEDESVQDVREITISGTTDPDAFVVAVIGTNEVITQADETGSFSIQNSLFDGPNVILIFSINEDGMVTSTERTVTFTTDPIEVGSSDESEESSTDQDSTDDSTEESSSSEEESSAEDSESESDDS